MKRGWRSKTGTDICCSVYLLSHLFMRRILSEISQHTETKWKKCERKGRLRVNSGLTIVWNKKLTCRGFNFSYSFFSFSLKVKGNSNGQQWQLILFWKGKLLKLLTRSGTTPASANQAQLDLKAMSCAETSTMKGDILQKFHSISGSHLPCHREVNNNSY